MTTIIGIEVENRKETAIEVQEVLTEYGCEIKTRLGINDYHKEECTFKGLILIDVPKQDKAEEMLKKLQSIKNVTVRSMDF